MPSLWIKHARIIDPAAKRDAVGDLFIADGRIVSSLSAAAKKRARQIDAVLPRAAGRGDGSAATRRARNNAPWRQNV